MWRTKLSDEFLKTAAKEVQDDLDKFVGKTLHKVTVAEDGGIIVFQFSDGTLVSLAADLCAGFPHISSCELEPEPL
jgi:hypothetical protein